MRGFGKGRHDRNRTGPGVEATLDTVRSGDAFDVVTIGDAHARMNALRFGMAEGARISCVTRIPAGPIVIRSGRQEIAIGRNLARTIQVRHAAAMEV